MTEMAEINPQLSPANNVKATYFTCGKCTATYTRKDQLSTHLNSHVELKKHVCEICVKGFQYDYTLKKHKKLMHGMIYPRVVKQYVPGKKVEPATFLCDRCPTKCQSDAALQIHMRTHTGERPFTCDVCLVSFKRKQHLASHIASHLGKHPFACDMCKVKFTCKASLLRHIKNKHEHDY